MRILTVTNLFPNSVQTRHGIFVEQRLRKLLATGRIEARVVAPVPWFPFSGGAFGRYAEFAAIPPQEDRNGIEVRHPRVPVIPKVGMSVAPLLMAAGMKSTLRKVAADGFDYDLIDAHYFYPDGVAATLLGTRLRKPVVITARGTDINLIPNYRAPRKWIQWAAGRCSAIISVSHALKDRLCDLGAPESKIFVLPNGVDLEFFHPSARRDEIRRDLGVDGLQMLSVGNLIDDKGHDLVIEALDSLPGASLIVVGDGPARQRLVRRAAALGVGNRVRFTGTVSQTELVDYYNAADLLVLASVSEGMPNVVLEAIACGTPVVATPTGGAVEILTSPDAGEVLNERSAAAIVEHINRLTARNPSRDATRRHAERFGWDATIRDQIGLYERLVAGR